MTNPQNLTPLRGVNIVVVDPAAPPGSGGLVLRNVATWAEAVALREEYEQAGAEIALYGAPPSRAKTPEVVQRLAASSAAWLRTRNTGGRTA